MLHKTKNKKQTKLINSIIYVTNGIVYVTSRCGNVKNSL